MLNLANKIKKIPFHLMFMSTLPKRYTFAFLIAISTKVTSVVAQQPFEKRLNCLERAGLNPEWLQPLYMQKNALSARVGTTPFMPDSITYGSSLQVGNPINFSSSTKITYGPQNKPSVFKHYTNTGAGFSEIYTHYLTHNNNGRITRQLAIAAIPSQANYIFEQNFDTAQRLTSQKTLFPVNSQFQLVSGDSLEYILQNGQLTTIVNRIFNFQLQQWTPFARYSNIQLDATNQFATAYREETWDSTSSSWQQAEYFKSLQWELYYEGIHQIAGFYIFTFNERPYNFPTYRAVNIPYPSRMVYGIENGLTFDTLWHYYPTYDAGQLVLVNKDQFLNGIRQPSSRTFYGNDGFGLPSIELLERWISNQWTPFKKIVNTRNQQLNFATHIDSVWDGGTAAWVPYESSAYQYDSLASGNLAQITTIDDFIPGTPPSLSRAVFWYNGISADNPKQMANQLLLYPNPVKEGLRVTGLKVPGILRCYDLAGKLIFETAVESEEQWIDWRSVPAGLYLVNIEGSGYYKNARILKTD